MSAPKPLYRIKIKSEFSASHQLNNYHGRCEELHGHNFQVEVEVQGSELEPQTGILIDFKELKALLTETIDNLDHKHLNNLPFFQDQNPSSENLACYIYQDLANKLRQKKVKLIAVSVSEKESSKATYLEIQ